jgi:hypothetical protein
MITPEESTPEPRDLAAYGFDAPRARLILTDDRETFALSIGRDAPGGQLLYLRRDDQPEIMVASRDILATLPASVLELRDRRLFSGHPGRIRRIELTQGIQAFQAVRGADDQWTIQRPFTVRGAASALRQWLDRLYEFRVHDFIADSVAAASLYGFNDPLLQITLATDPPATPQTLTIGRSADANETVFYATRSGQDTVFTITRETIDWLRTETSAFRDRALLDLAAAQIRYIQISVDEQNLILQQSTQGVWEVTAPKRFPADDRRVQEVISRWTGAKVDTFIAPSQRTPGDFDPGPGQQRIVFARQPLPEPLPPPSADTTAATPVISADTAAFLVARTQPTNALRLAPLNALYGIEVTPALAQDLAIDPLRYRDPVVLAVDPATVRRISQRTADSLRLVERTNHLFQAAAAGDPPDPAAIDTLLGLVSRLRAFRFVEEDPRTLERYGLYTPRHQLILGLSGAAAINKVLLLGDDASPEETYAMIQGGDVVFTLPRSITEQVLVPVTRPADRPPASAEPIPTP